MQWILNERSHPHALSFKAIQNKMQSLAPSSFSASSGWLYGFLKRHNLSLRSITHKVRLARQSDITQNTTSLAAKISSFRSFVSDQIHQHNLINEQIYNVDQTPVWFEMTPKRTIDRVGVKNVSAVIPAASGHEKVSVVLACYHWRRQAKVCVGEDGGVLCAAHECQERRRRV